MEKIEREIEQLRKELETYQRAYYVDSRPLVDDSVYDRKFDRLLELERRYPGFASPTSPTVRVGSDISGDFPEVEHTIAVLSLDKAYTEEELLSWIGKLEKNAPDGLGIIIEEKIDGVSIVLYYENGVLRRAVTRGNGVVGNDVSANVKTIPTIPLTLPEAVTVAVRGEIHLPKAEFETLNRTLETPYANPRNLASGTLRRIKSSEVARIPLRIFAYEGFWNTDQPTTHLEVLAKLKAYGFTINEHFAYFTKNAIDAGDALEAAGLKAVSGSWEEIGPFIREQTERRAALAYEIDGLVAKVDSIAYRETLGYTGHHPRWALAYKFESPQAVTTLLGIDVQVGRTGRVTPVARVRPARVAGSTIGNITLHNQEYINGLELGIGDLVEISRRGDVIPAVERVIEKAEENTGVWRMPSRCPSCDTPLEERGAHTFCPNGRNCPAQILGRIEFFVSKEGMDIENFGPSTVKDLVDLGALGDIQDIYSIDYEEILSDRPGYGPKKIALIKEGVEESKNRPFRQVLMALGIPELGKKGADLLIASGLDSIDKLLAVAEREDVETLLSIDRIGEKIARLYIDALNDRDMRTRIEALRSAGLSMEEKIETSTVKQIFAGQTWCITGTFERFKPRDLALREVEKRGGKTTGGVTRSTTVLLAGPGAGSKLAKARELGIRIIDEAEFLQMLGE
ncbi:MAG: NAD-dependent DNA ligase LigA [Spirochaetales bacterium]|nr:NAD-dependent DNA ligase LigA [Spirochaetales bacterium]